LPGVKHKARHKLLLKVEFSERKGKVWFNFLPFSFLLNFMSVRHPPPNRVPPVAGGRRNARNAPRVVRYEEPPTGFFRRWSRRIFSPPVIVALVFLLTLTLSVFGYYYYVFSARIDRMLRGEIFTRTSGIYAAPRTLRTGENLTQDDLIELLRRAGYVERGQQAESSRGRFHRAANTLEVEPGQDTMVDGRRLFPRLRVGFNRNNRGVVSIRDLQTNSQMQTALLEPEQISSFTGEERSRRRIVGFGDLPQHLIQAITVTEDRSFFDHYGINFRGILRAFLRRYDSDPNSPIANQGGSSITQQLIKNLLLSPERTWRRKFAEAYMSVILETRLTKQEIFALYCNEVYLGQRAGFSINGFGEAADAYFNKDITQLTLDEAAFLAGIIRSPNRYNPYRNLQTATDRRNQVLQSMTEAGMITELQRAQAQARELRVAPRGRIDRSEAPYFVDYAQEQLGDILADVNSAQHLRIYTSIDMDLQRAAYMAVTRQLAALDRAFARRIPPGTLQASLVAMNAQTGEIVAMVGGRDYERSQLNRATDAMRQPGSVFKPFVYATALNTAFDPTPRTITAATTYQDAPQTFRFDNREYTPGNYGDTYSNAPVTLRDALVRSLNVVTVQVAMDVTLGRVMNMAHRAGLPRPDRAYPAHALGTSEASPLQIASAYTAFARGGTRTAPRAISRVTTGRGDTVAQPAPERNEVMRPEVAFIMNSFMKDVTTRGTAARLRERGFRHNVAGKTGTSRDGWFAGYTPNLVCVVWVGFDDNSQLGMTGAESALPIWADFMNAALNSHPEWQGDWQPPAGVQQIEIDPRTGGLATDDNPNRRAEFFINGTAPIAPIEPTGEEELPLEGETDEEFDYGPAPTLPTTPGGTIPPPMPSPGDGTSPPRRGRAPTLEGTGVQQDDGSTRLLRTISVDICPTTRLLAAPTCPVVRTQTFAVGQEPHRYCGPENHGGIITSLPPPSSSSRPRTSRSP
jgi:penicillin-binding protein 1B